MRSVSRHPWSQLSGEFWRGRNSTVLDVEPSCISLLCLFFTGWQFFWLQEPTLEVDWSDPETDRSINVNEWNRARENCRKIKGRERGARRGGDRNTDAVFAREEEMRSLGNRVKDCGDGSGAAAVLVKMN